MSLPSYIKLSPQMDTATLVNALNQNFNIVQSRDRSDIITDEDGFDRIIIGKQPDGSYNIKVSEPGVSVGDASDDQLIMNSDWQMWKIINSTTTDSVYLDATKIHRAGSISLNSTYIGYVRDVIIYLPDTVLQNATAGYSGQIQIFARDYGTKQDVTKSGLFQFDGSNWGLINHEYFYNIDNNALVIRTSIRWMSGTVSFTPSDGTCNPAMQLYWAIANPTKARAGGKGGGGTPTGRYVYYDSIVFNATGQQQQYLEYSTYNPVTVANYAFDTTVYSYTYQFFDDATSWKFPMRANLPVSPRIF